MSTLARRSVRRLTVILAIMAATTAATAWQPALAAPPGGDDAHRFLTVMTRNLDHGTDFGPVFTATTPGAFLAAATTIYNEVLASRPAERAQGIAREIAATRPALVSLQEAAIWRTGPIFQPPATTVTVDQLQSLEDALAAMGVHYAPISVLTESDFEAPSTLGIDIRFTDRDVLLARTDLPPGQLELANVQAKHFIHLLTFPTIAGTFTVVRGWISVDATVRGSAVRVIATHLEAFAVAIQQAQVAEVDAGPASGPLPSILAGDLNTGPGVSPAYDDLIAAAWVDTWPAANPGDPGFTWPLHLEDPFTPSATPFQRIDLILVRAPLQPSADSLVGNTAADLTPSGLWPSDHVGVVATIRIPSGLG